MKPPTATQLEKAQRLVEEGRVEVEVTAPHGCAATVRGDEGAYKVQLWHGAWTCTCPVQEFHPSQMCSHCAAVELYRETVIGGNDMSEEQEYTGPPLCGLTEAQVTALQAPLDPEHVSLRENKFSYIEGHHAIREANRIFGPAGWSRETISMECVYKGAYTNSSGRKGYQVAYVAKVRVMAVLGDRAILKEGTGYGDAIDYNSPAAAFEGSAKEAETDAMKRALMMFGDPFGLALYDKAQKHVATGDGSAAPAQASGGQQQAAPSGAFAPCPKCGSELRERKSAKGPFVGCSSYKSADDKGCGYTSDVGDAPRAAAAAPPAADIPVADDEGYPTTGAAMRQWMTEVLLVPDEDLGDMRAKGAVRAWGASPADWSALTPEQVGVLARAIKEEVDADPFWEQ